MNVGGRYFCRNSVELENMPVKMFVITNSIEAGIPLEVCKTSESDGTCQSLWGNACGCCGGME